MKTLETMEMNVMVGNGGELVAPTEATEVVEVAENSTKKVSFRQDFLKVVAQVIDNKDVVCQSIGVDTTEFDKMVEYFNTQINKTKTVSSEGNYKPTEKAQTILEILFAFEGETKTGKEIAENSKGILKANGVSGSIRGLVSNNLVSATNDSPKKYTITQVGVDYMNSLDSE